MIAAGLYAGDDGGGGGGGGDGGYCCYHFRRGFYRGSNEVYVG